MNKPVEIEGEKMNTNGVHHVEDEDESETSFGDEQNGFLDRLGVKIDDSITSNIYRVCNFLIFLFNEKFISFVLVSVDFVLIIQNIQLYLY